MADNNEVQFKYIFPEDYNPTYANGVFGGVSPNGEIVSNFTFERLPIPHSIYHNLTQDGNLGSESRKDPPGLNSMVIRYVTNGVVLNLRVAKSFHEWLGLQIKIAEGIETKIRENESQLNKPEGE